MSRLKKESESLHCRIKSEISRDLNQYCDETGFSKTVVVEKALKSYLLHEADDIYRRKLEDQTQM